jgi:hypothetical protein
MVGHRPQGSKRWRSLRAYSWQAPSPQPRACLRMRRRSGPSMESNVKDRPGLGRPTCGLGPEGWSTHTSIWYQSNRNRLSIQADRFKPGERSPGEVNLIAAAGSTAGLVSEFAGFRPLLGVPGALGRPWDRGTDRSPQCREPSPTGARSGFIWRFDPRDERASRAFGEGRPEDRPARSDPQVNVDGTPVRSKYVRAPFPGPHWERGATRCERQSPPRVRTWCQARPARTRRTGAGVQASGRRPPGRKGQTAIISQTAMMTAYPPTTRTSALRFRVMSF